MPSPTRPARILRLLSLSAVCLVVATSAACGNRSAPARGRGAASSKRAQPGTPTESTTPVAAHPQPAEAVRSSSPPETVTFVTDDHVTISAALRVGRPNTYPVVLVHQLGSAHAEWDSLVAELATARLTTLAIDLRGHGESTSGAGTNTRSYAYASFRDADWIATQKDVRAAVDFLAAKEELHVQQVVLIGSSIGGTACVAAAANDPRVARVVMLSPGRAYHGFDAILPASRLGQRPLLVLHSSEELPSGETSDVLDRIVADSTVRPVPGTAHGVSMFQDDPSQLTAIVDFVRAAQPR